MERAAGFAHDDTAQVKLDKLDAVLALAPTSKQDAALFAEMLSLPNDGRYPTLELEACSARAETGGILTAFWIGDSTGIDSPLGGGRCRLPILLIFEVG